MEYITICTNCISKIQIFKEDDNGVPPGCHKEWCPMDHRNKLFNENDYAKRFGKFGFEYFHHNRAFYFGLVSLATILAMIITTYGCFALSVDRNIVQRTYWTGGKGFNSSSGQYFAMYVGLRSLEYVNCEFVPGYDNYPASCNRQSIEFGDPTCLHGPVSAACEACASVANTMWSMAFMTCAGLILAFLGAQTRMRLRGDCPVQKLLGMGSDGWGTLTLAIALFSFNGGCNSSLDRSFNDSNVKTNFWTGPGIYCYSFCCMVAFMRALVHWLTPIPSGWPLVSNEEGSCAKPMSLQEQNSDDLDL